jgi:uncharacterized protein
MKVFLDSSAFAKRFLNESGSEEVFTKCENAEEVVLSAIAGAEVISAISRLKRQQKISMDQFLEIKKHLLTEMTFCKIVQIDENVLSKTIEYLEKLSLRTLDAIHLACAIEACVDLFITADLKQAEGARSVGLQVYCIR